MSNEVVPSNETFPLEFKFWRAHHLYQSSGNHVYSFMRSVIKKGLVPDPEVFYAIGLHDPKISSLIEDEGKYILKILYKNDEFEYLHDLQGNTQESQQRFEAGMAKTLNNFVTGRGNAICYVTIYPEDETCKSCAVGAHCRQHFKPDLTEDIDSLRVKWGPPPYYMSDPPRNFDIIALQQIIGDLNRSHGDFKVVESRDYFDDQEYKYTSSLVFGLRRPIPLAIRTELSALRRAVYQHESRELNPQPFLIQCLEWLVGR